MCPVSKNMAAECDSSCLPGTTLCASQLACLLSSSAWLPRASVSSSIELRVWSPLLLGAHTGHTDSPDNRRSLRLCSEDGIRIVYPGCFTRVLSSCVRQMGLLGDSSSELIPCTGPHCSGLRTKALPLGLLCPSPGREALAWHKPALTQCSFYPLA